MKKIIKRVAATKEQNMAEPHPVVIESTTPTDLMAKASNVASVCKEIVERTANQIQGKKYVRVEGWEAIAAAHGCHAGADTATRDYDANGEHIGYKAKGYVRDRNGVVIATGEGFVGFDEKDRKGNTTWKNRAEYAGRAMAQTRAISRACRSVFAHVLVLIGGLETTPAEEIPHDEPEPPINRDRSGKKYDFRKADNVGVREAMVKSLRAFLSEHGIPETFLMGLCHEHGMADGSEEKLGDLKDGVLTRLNGEKGRERTLALWQQEAEHSQSTGKCERATENQTPVSFKRAMLIPDYEPTSVLKVAQVESWKDVVILSGVNKDIALGDLTKAQLKNYIGRWKPTETDEGYSDDDLLMDAALTLAAEEA